jgi:DNA-binding helix-hairpin-helix protein with protein kinase domain/Tfp pilus assembly protein PilF
MKNEKWQMNRVFYNSDAGIVRTGEQIGAGGEGAVFEVQGRCDLAAKIYHLPPTTEKAEKLLALSRLGTGRLYKLSAWPVDVLRSQPGGDVAGFVMKRINEGREVHQLHSPKSRLQSFPEASWAFLIYVAANIVRAITTVHEHGFVIGDVNPKNILVSRSATVFLLDCDSFQVSAGGKSYRCEGGFPEYTPPELQGRAFGAIDRQPEHDYFGLAVAIFQLLFLGRHPFSGLYLGAGEMPLERAIRERRFAYGVDSESRQMKQPPGALSMEAVPKPIADLFRRAFLSATAAERPGPQEWIAPLESLTKSLKMCDLHSGHHFCRELSECPWCGIETGVRIRLFNFPRTGRDRGHFKLDEVWQEISSISPPPAPPPIRAVEFQEPSHLGLKAMRERRWDLVLAIVFAFVAGFTIGLTTSSVLLLSLAAIGVIGIATGKGLLFFRFKNSKSLSPVAEEIQTVMREADENVRELEKKWKEQATDERFINKFSELQNRKETYERIPRIRQVRLDVLEAKGDDVTHRARIAVEKEIDDLRHSLEHELRSGAFYLSRVKSQIEESRQRLLPSLLNEQQTLAQAAKDWEVATRRNGRKLVILILIIAFFVGSSFRPEVRYETQTPPVIKEGSKAPVRGDAQPEEPGTTEKAERGMRVYPAGTSPRAIELYEQGAGLVSKARFVEAVTVLEKAVKDDTRIAVAWQQLGYAHYRLGNLEESFKASSRAVTLMKTFGSLYNLGLVHDARKNWREAKWTFSRAVEYCGAGDWNESCSVAYDKLARSIHELWEAKMTIRELEKSLDREPNLSYERFKLALLYLWSGDHAAAERHYRMLMGKNRKLAQELAKLMRKFTTKITKIEQKTQKEAEC